MVQNKAGSFSNAEKRFISNVSLHTGHPFEKFINIAKLGAASGNYNPLFHDVRYKLRRSVVKNILHGRSDVQEMRIKGFGNFIGINY